MQNHVKVFFQLFEINPYLLILLMIFTADKMSNQKLYLQTDPLILQSDLKEISNCYKPDLAVWIVDTNSSNLATSILP